MFGFFAASEVANKREKSTSNFIEMRYVMCTCAADMGGAHE